MATSFVKVFNGQFVEVAESHTPYINSWRTCSLACYARIASRPCKGKFGRSLIISSLAKSCHFADKNATNPLEV